MHASHATHDVKTDLLRSGEARKIKGTGRSGYLGVKGFTPSGWPEQLKIYATGCGAAW